MKSHGTTIPASLKSLTSGAKGSMKGLCKIGNTARGRADQDRRERAAIAAYVCRRSVEHPQTVVRHFDSEMHEMFQFADAPLSKMVITFVIFDTA